MVVAIVSLRFVLGALAQRDATPVDELAMWVQLELASFAFLGRQYFKACRPPSGKNRLLEFFGQAFATHVGG